MNYMEFQSIEIYIHAVLYKLKLQTKSQSRSSTKMVRIIHFALLLVLFYPLIITAQGYMEEAPTFCPEGFLMQGKKCRKISI